LKIGCTTDAAAVHAPAGQLKSADNAVLATPPDPVSVIWGK
jgi:hypothetical protein